jgi:lambda family phage portal protein
MALQSLNLDLPPMSQIVAERRKAERRAERKATLQRRWEAARYTNLTADWPTWHTTANSDLRNDLRALRARNRHLFQNNGVMRKFSSLLETNVIGSQGMTLRVSFDSHGNSTPERDAELAQYVEGKFAEWSRPDNCTASGKMSLTGVGAFAVRMLARDGEFLCRELTNAGNPFGYALNFRDVAWLDETYNAIIDGGNRVLMSVEYDDNDRPVRYWLTRPKTDYLYAEYKPREAFRTPVPASEVIHKFIVTEDELQARGVPWGAAAMEPIHVLGGVISAELYASRANACNTDYIIPPSDEDEEGEAESPSPEHPDFPVGSTRDLQSAVQQILPPGYKVQSNDPKHPNANLGDFIKSLKRDIGAALLTSYESLANDREGVNYSSIRAGLLEDRDIWRMLQLFMIEHFYHRVFQNWLKQAMLTGAVQLSIRDYARISDNWRPRGWDWVDPLKDIQAAILAINNGLDSRTDYCDERGKDFARNVKYLGEENKAMDAVGLNLIPPVEPKPTVKKETEQEDAGGTDNQAGGDKASRLLPIFESQLLPRRSNGDSELLG